MKVPSKNLEELCTIIGDSFTKSELKGFLLHASIPEVDDGSQSFGGYGYVRGLRKIGMVIQLFG